MGTVLIVDDRPINRKFLAALLGCAGHQVVEAADGIDALNQVHRSRPDLIISDVMMPVMDGLELVKRLRANAATASIPVVFYTAAVHVQETRDLARSWDVDRVLPKPSESQLILDTVRKILDDQAPDAELASRSRGSDSITDGNQPNQLAGTPPQVRRAPDSAIDAAASALAPTLESGSDSAPVHALSLRLAALLELVLTLGAERDPQRLLDVFSRAAQDIVGTRHAGVLLVDADSGALLNWTVSGRGAKSADKLASIDLVDGFMGRALRSQDPIRKSMDSGDPTLGGLPASHPPILAVLAAPMRSPSGTSGVLYFADKINRAPFDAEDEQIAATLAAQLALFYSNLKLVEGLQNHAGQLQIEVDERKRIAEELRESETLFRQMAETIRDVFFLLDADSQGFLYVSAAYEEVVGRSCASLYADPTLWAEAIHPDDRDQALETYARGIAEGSFEYECRVVRPDGAIRWLNVRGFSVRNDAGETIRIAGIAKDITERTLAAAALTRSRERLDLATESARIGIWDFDVRANELLWDAQMCELHGLAAQNFSGAYEAWQNALHPSDRKRAESEFASALAGIRDFHTEFRVVWPNGEEREIEAHAVVQRADDGSATRITGVNWDISPRKVADAELRESERRFSELLRNIELASVMFDREARITFCNDHLLQLTGYRREQVLGRNWFELFMPPQAGRDTKEFFANLQANVPEAWLREHEILTRTGARRLMRWNNTVLRSGTGAVIGSASIGEDITEQRRAEIRIKHLNRIRAVIGGIGSAMLRLRDRNQLLSEVCRVAATAGVFPLAWVDAPNPQTGRFEVVVSHGVDPQAIDFLTLAMRKSIPETDQPSYRAASTKRPIVLNDLRAEPTLAPIGAQLQRRGYRSCAALPLFVDAQVTAVLVLFASEREFFDAEEMTLLEWLTADLSFALEQIAANFELPRN